MIALLIIIAVLLALIAFALISAASSLSIISDTLKALRPPDMKLDEWLAKGGRK